MSAPKPWKPRIATERIWQKAKDPNCQLHWTAHVRDRLAERGLIMGDVRHVLKYGYVYEEGEPARDVGTFAYKMESETPNSNRRVVRVIVVPTQSCSMTVVSVMWRDP